MRHGNAAFDRHVRTGLIVVSLAGLLSPRNILAIAPPYLTDSELAGHPVLVVAKWNKAPMRPHRLSEGNVLKKFEVFTDIEVIRVIKGDIKPGTHTLLLGWGIGWEENGKGLRTGTSTDLPGDVDDVSKPNLWFLDRSKSWDESDKKTYYHLTNYRAIQPRNLESYFKAVAAREPRKEVPTLLSSNDPEVLRHVLRYISGDVLPWPYEPAEWERLYSNDKRGNPLKDQAAAVRDLINRDVPEIRPLAVAVYADLAGKDGVPNMRLLLKDKDPQIRAVAAGALARMKDTLSIPVMSDAVRGLKEPHLSCKIVHELSAWGVLELAPALISFLENDSCWGRYGREVGSPAVQAREALYQIANCWFPYDVTQSLQAWSRTPNGTDPDKRRKELRKLLPETHCPLAAEFSGSVDDGFVKITNTSLEKVAITRYPAWVDANAPGLWSGAGTDYKEPTAATDFVLLQPGESTRVKLSFGDHFKGVGPEQLELSLFYSDLATRFGLPGWIGWVDVPRVGSPEKQASTRSASQPNSAHR